MEDIRRSTEEEKREMTEQAARIVAANEREIEAVKAVELAIQAEKIKQGIADEKYGKGRGIKYVGFRPTKCPQCQGEMDLIPKQKQAWKCRECKLEIWTGDFTTFEEMHDMLHSSPREVLNLDGAVSRKGGSKSGKRRKKPRKMVKNYYFNQ